MLGGEEDDGDGVEEGPQHTADTADHAQEDVGGDIYCRRWRCRGSVEELVGIVEIVWGELRCT